ncbi:hypothetical protein [Embleya sp. NPDC005575]|uniref:hypothetical protein n=1 Tax=Embleya sp. NPDC005575 TaxID=3156892 RepID=UPI0033A53B48
MPTVTWGTYAIDHDMTVGHEGCGRPRFLVPDGGGCQLPEAVARPMAEFARGAGA